MYPSLLPTNIYILSGFSLQVKVIVNLKGRESDFRNNAIELIRRFQADVGEVITVVVVNCYFLPQVFVLSSPLPPPQWFPDMTMWDPLTTNVRRRLFKYNLWTVHVYNFGTRYAHFSFFKMLKSGHLSRLWI